MVRVALATYAAIPSLTQDDQLLLAYLHRLGWSVQVVVWDDPDICWSDFSCVVIRSCWDYHQRIDEFLRWVDAIERLDTVLINSPRLVRWNCDKLYLIDLESRNIPIVPTYVSEKNETLKTVIEKKGWRQAVVKPRISATAYQTWLTSLKTPESDQHKFEKMRGQFTSVIIQEFIPEVKSKGEWSFIFFAGEFSHAVLKKPRPGDFRVQDNFGGQVLNYEPGAQLVKQAATVLEALDEITVYARVDGLEKDGRLILMELELIEPFLFLGVNKSSIKRFAKAINLKLNRVID